MNLIADVCQDHRYHINILDMALGFGNCDLGGTYKFFFFIFTCQIFYKFSNFKGQCHKLKNVCENIT